MKIEGVEGLRHPEPKVGKVLSLNRPRWSVSSHDLSASLRANLADDVELKGRLITKQVQKLVMLRIGCGLNELDWRHI